MRIEFPRLIDTLDTLPHERMMIDVYPSFLDETERVKRRLALDVHHSDGLGTASTLSGRPRSLRRCLNIMTCRQLSFLFSSLCSEPGALCLNVSWLALQTCSSVFSGTWSPAWLTGRRLERKTRKAGLGNSVTKARDNFWNCGSWRQLGPAVHGPH